jgi:hypothetical protein
MFSLELKGFILGLQNFVIFTLALLLPNFWWESAIYKLWWESPEWIYLVIDPMVSKVVLNILIELFLVWGLFKNMAICLFVCCFMFT